MQTTTLEQVRQKVLNRRPSLSDEVVSLKSLVMDAAQPKRIIIRRPGSANEQSYPFDARVYSQASGVLYGLPGAYLEKLVDGEKGDPILAAQNFNHWVAQNKDREVLLRFRDQEVEGTRVRFLRALKPASWNPIPYETTLETFIAKFGPDKEVFLSTFDEDMLVMEFIMRRLDYKVNKSLHVAVDDPVEWGMRFRDSDAGMGDALLAPYTRRLLCLNGATMTTEGIVMRISHSGKMSSTLEAVQSNLRQGIEMVDGYSNAVGDQIAKAHEIPLEISQETQQPELAIEKLRTGHAVTKLEEKYVREAWKVEGETIPDPTLWRLHNAVTRAGTHGEELGTNERLKLQAVGGQILETATRRRHLWN